MPRSLVLLILAALTLAACTKPGETVAPPPNAPLPQRVYLHYDFSGDWAATAGDHCDERLDLSQGVFLTIGRPVETEDNFHVARFFMLEEADKAEALVGIPDEEGTLVLLVETQGVIDGQQMEIVYLLALKPKSAHYIRLTEFTMTVRDRAGESVQADLLAHAAADPTIPVLSAAGENGLCLKRL